MLTGHCKANQLAKSAIVFIRVDVMNIGTQPGFLRRISIAAINILTPLCFSIVALYYVVREVSGGEPWLIDVLGYILPWLLLPAIVLLPAVILLHRSRIMYVLTLTPVVIFIFTYGHLYLPDINTPPSSSAFSVMTYNVLGSNPHLDHLSVVIDADDPDIVGLHELSPSMIEFLDDHYAEHYPFRRLEKWVGLMSRYPILEYEFFQLSEGNGTWAQRFVLDIDGHHTNLLNIHLQSPPLKGIHPFGLPIGIPTGFLNQRRDADTLDVVSRAEILGDPILVIGDFNLADQQSLYASLTEHLKDAHSESGWGMGFTFSRFPPFAPAMWRIDYILYSQALVALKTTTGDYGGSDHRPVIALLAFREID